MVNLYVGITDYDWFRFLSTLQGVEEVNFWQPGGRRLKDDFENGRHYYAMHGKALSLPLDPRQHPAREALEWHQTNRFLG
jgi:hypothetical protein